MSSVKINNKIKELESELAKFKACDILRLKLSLDKIKDTGSKFSGSGVIVDIKTLDGMSITGAFAIFDGLSESTISSLTADIERTYLSRVDMTTPRNLREAVTRLYRSKT